MAETPSPEPDDFTVAVKRLTDTVQAAVPTLTTMFTAVVSAFEQAYETFQAAGYFDECARSGCGRPRIIHGTGLRDGGQTRNPCPEFLAESD